MQDRGLKPPDDMMSCSRPLLDRRLKPHAEQAQKCPRCESTNTKFCYYNNYSLSQPRYFCKTCRRYWTQGGTLRNVPVGGGCRKNKRAKRSVDQGVSLPNEASPSANNNGCEGTSCPPMEDTPLGLPPAGASSSVYYNLGNEGEDLPGFAYARAPLQSNLAQLGSLSSLNAHMHSLKNPFPGLDLPGCSQAPLSVADLSCLFEAHQQQISAATSSAAAISHVSDGFGSFNVPVEGLNGIDVQQWRLQQQKLGLPLGEDGQVSLLPFDESVMEGLRQQHKLRQSNMLPAAKAQDEGNRTGHGGHGPPDWQVPPEGFFETGGGTGGDSVYWNGGTTWPDLSGYGPSSSPLI